MQLIDLLNAMTMAGLTPALDDGRLIVRGPTERLTPEMKASLRDHKSTLLGCLSPGRSDLAFADSPAAAEGLAECLRYFNELAGDVTAARTGRTVLVWPEAVQTPCRRCSSDQACAVVIHGGESIRRDCARCGAYRDFAIWRDSAAVEEILGAVADFGRLEEASRPGADDAEAALTETP